MPSFDPVVLVPKKLIGYAYVSIALSDADRSVIEKAKHAIGAAIACEDFALNFFNVPVSLIGDVGSNYASVIAGEDLHAGGLVHIADGKAYNVNVKPMAKIEADEPTIVER